MKTFVHVPLIVLSLLLLPVSARSQADKPGTIATSTAKSGATGSAAAPSEQRPAPDAEQPRVPVVPASSQPFVPGWLLTLFMLVAAGEFILAAIYFGVGTRLGAAQTAAQAAQAAIGDLRESTDDVGTKLAALRDEVNAIRRSQEPILAIAVNRMASASQFPFAPQVTAIRPDRGVPEGGTQVSITGRNFSPDAQIWFGGINQAAKTSSTATRLDVNAPAGSAGEVEIYVVNPNGMMSQQQRPLTYRYTPFHLAEIAISEALDAPLRLTGEGFSDTTRVLIDGQDAGPATLRNDKSLQLPVPAGGRKGDKRKVVLVNEGGDRSEEIAFVQP